MLYSSVKTCSEKNVSGKHRPVCSKTLIGAIRAKLKRRLMRRPVSRWCGRAPIPIADRKCFPFRYKRRAIREDKLQRAVYALVADVIGFAFAGRAWNPGHE